MDQKYRPPPYAQQPPNVLYVQPPVTIQAPPVSYGPEPQQTVCKNCDKRVLTAIKSEATTRTHLMALVLCCFLCWPCVCLPYCMDTCRNRNHYCPDCNAFLGTYTN